MKRNIRCIYFILLAAFCVLNQADAQSNIKVMSPERGTTVVFTSTAANLLYKVSYQGQDITDWSKLGFLIDHVVAAQTTIEHMGPVLQEPEVTNGRMIGYFWLHLQRNGDKFTGFTSNDGKSWREQGSLYLTFKRALLISIPVASCMPNATTVMFDHVSFSLIK